MARFQDLPTEILLAIFQEAFSHMLWCSSNYLNSASMRDWPLFGKRLTPIALTALLHTCFITEPDEDLWGWLTAPRATGSFSSFVRDMHVCLVWPEDKAGQESFLAAIQSKSLPRTIKIELTLQCEDGIFEEQMVTTASLIIYWRVSSQPTPTFRQRI
jgi:hypothetical protein